MNPLTVVDYSTELRTEWDEFVLAHRHGSPFHLTAWKQTIETIFGYRPHYLAAFEAGRVRAVLPMFLVSNLVMGKVLLSSPFAVYGGILADCPAGQAALRDRARRLAEELRVQHLELRNAWPEQRAGFALIDRYVTFTQEAGAADDEAVLQSIPKKTRNLVRKALRHPYSTRSVRDPGNFYRLLCIVYRRLGTPVFPLRFFSAILENFGAMADIREAVLEGKVAAASLNFFFRDQMHTYYAASDPDSLPMAPNNYLYFDHLRWAGRNGFRVFDFGRSKRETGTYEFKRHWATTMRPLPYEVLLVRRKQMPDFSPKNPKFDPAIRLWRRMPLPLTRLLGPPLVKLFP